MRLIALFLSLLVAAPAVLVHQSAPLAAENPMTGGPAAGGDEKKAEPKAAEPSALGDVGRWIFDLQRRTNRAIATHMQAIRDGNSLAPLFIGILLALAYGAIHTLGPGHGKFVVTTYFLAREAKLAKGLLMGLQIAVTHVIAAIVAVFVADLVLRQMFGGSPAQLVAVRMISYGLIAVIGLAMLVQAIRRALGHATGHHHHHGHDHDHGAAVQAGGRQMTLLSLSVGLIPCTGALLVMLYALANDMLLTGAILVAAISIGMAGMLAVLAVIAILFRRAVTAGFAKRGDKPSRWAQGIDILGGLAIALVGLVLLAGTIWRPIA